MTAFKVKIKQEPTPHKWVESPCRAQRANSSGRSRQWSALQAFGLCIAMLGAVHCQNTHLHCEDVQLLPKEITYTTSMDTSDKLLDIHSHLKFFTFQLPTVTDSETNVVSYKISPKQASARLDLQLSDQSSANDLLFRLKATLHSSNMDNIDQGMRVMLIDSDSGHVVVDTTSEDHDERSVHLDSVELSSSKNYMIKYQFYQKNLGVINFQDKMISGGHLGSIACSRPFVSQELVLASKQLLIQRAKAYKNALYSREENESKLMQQNEISTLNSKCDLTQLDNSQQSLEQGERGLYCTRSTYYYKPGDIRSNDLSVIFQKKFDVVGAKKEAVTYLFDLTIGVEFAFGEQVKAVLKRVDGPETSFNYDPLVCMYNHSCIVSESIGKNEIGISVILTPGSYELVLFDQEESTMRNWLTRDAGLDTIPFSFELQATPVVQNEEREMCGDRLYMHENFIQNRFIDNKDGQQFVFDDEIILNLINATQSFVIEPEKDMLIKVFAKEAYGVNVVMKLCSGSDCSQVSSQTGNANLLFATVKRGKKYKLVFDYSHSILELHSFYDCPHIRVLIAMTSEALAQDKIKATTSKSSSELSKMFSESSARLGNAFNLLSTASTLNGASFILSGHDNLFSSMISECERTASTRLFVDGKFTVPDNREVSQMLVEVFYDPMFYDIEVFIESESSIKTQSSRFSNSQVTDWKYKGSKKVHIELEPGVYRLAIVGRLPAQSELTAKYSPQYAEFQLHAVFGETVPSSLLQPSSMNYLGLMGINGTNFGQVVYHKPEIVLAPREALDLYFNITKDRYDSSAPSIDVQAIEYDGKSDMIGLQLDDVETMASNFSMPDGTKLVNIVPKHTQDKTSSYHDDWEDGVSAQTISDSKIKANTLHRVRLVNKDPAFSVRVALKVSISEKTNVQASRNNQNVPRSFAEISRIKPKVPGVKEGSFIQGSRKVMETFKVTSLTPFVPASSKVYGSVFKDTAFMPALTFEVKEMSNVIYATITEYSGRNDLFLSIYEDNVSGTPSQLARSRLGRYQNALGPVTLPKGQYRLMVHPDLDSDLNNDFITFGLDVLVEKPGNPKEMNVDSVIEEVELCSHPSLPDSFNGPGYLHSLSGNTLSLVRNFRISQALAGGVIRFELVEPSLVSFYSSLPEGLEGVATIERISGTQAASYQSKDLNKGEESFLRNENGFAHRAVIQVRKFLRKGKYAIRLQAKENNRATGIMPRCEAYTIGLTITPIKNSAKFPIDKSCRQQAFLPEHLKYDEVTNGSLWYPLHESTVDVGYLDLKKEGEGPFLFAFTLQYDPRILGVLGLSLSKYDQETASFQQSGLWKTPQDGILQLLTVVESGVYAIGIQTLTNTPSMFVNTKNIGHQVKKDLRLPQVCLPASFTYLVTSILPGDSKTITGGLSLFSLLVGDGIKSMMDKSMVNSKLLDELGDESNFDKEELKACEHSELPTTLPISASGFDRSFDVLVKEKPFDLIELVVETFSVFRVSIHTDNPKNQVSAYLLDNPNDAEAIAWTKGSGTSWSFVHLVKEKKKAYFLKIEYDNLDQSDSCPLVDLRMILKPVQNVLHSNLHCEKHDVPPQKIDVSGNDFVHENTYSFSHSFIHKVTDKGGDLEYDIHLNFQTYKKTDVFYLDIESQSDMLTGRMSFNLYYIKPDKSLGVLGHSEPAGSSAHDSRFVQRLKLMDLEEDINFEEAILRIRFPPSSIHLIDELNDLGKLKDEEACLTFDLNVRAEIKNDADDRNGLFSQTRLMRVRWEGDAAYGNIFDSDSRFRAVLEFDRNMQESFKMMKMMSFADFKPVTNMGVPKGSIEQNPKTIAAPLATLSSEDPSMLYIDFPGGSLSKGWCYKLNFHSVMSGADFDQSKLGNTEQICATSCTCNWLGTEYCHEDSQQCICAFPFRGKECSKCEQGYILNPKTNQCVLESKGCAEDGGSEDCSGHGKCVQSGKTTSCICDPGFVDDGLEKCSACAESLFSFPNCQVRSLVVEEPDFNCRDLGYKMPSKLWKEGPNKASKKEDPVQAEDGIVNWGQRYKLLNGNKLTTSSKHQFFIEEVSVMRLHVDSMGSGVQIKYVITNNDGEVLAESQGSQQNDGYVEQGNDFLILHRPKSGTPIDSPYKITFEYRHIDDSKSEKAEFTCPVIDIRLIIEPLKQAQEFQKCSDYELTESKKQRTSGWSFGSQSQVLEHNLTLSSNDKSLYTHQGAEEDKLFATVPFKLEIQDKNHMLTVLATYSFGSAFVSLSLWDPNGDLAVTDYTSSLRPKDDGVAEYGVVLPHSNSSSISSDDDMVTYLEAKDLEPGSYLLQLHFRRALFLPTKKFETCLNIGLTLEYTQAQNSNTQDDDYMIIGVIPTHSSKIHPKGMFDIQVLFDKPVDLDDLVESQADRLNICQLQGTRDSSAKIKPQAVHLDKENTVLRLDFNFKSSYISTSERCFRLDCQAQGKQSEGRILTVFDISHTEYCVETERQMETGIEKCNQHARPKLNKQGQCICSFPYTGSLCHDCESGYIKSTHVEDGVKETFCKQDIEQCSGKGRKVNGKCQCDQGVGGDFCDYCLDATQAWPDCSSNSDYDSSIYDNEAVHKQEEKERFTSYAYSNVVSHYFSKNSLEPSIFNEECGWVDFPDNLARVEYSRSFAGGEFHIADDYVVNHRQDNVMKFVPSQAGTIKVLLQQPEDIEAEQAPFDLEVAIYDPRTQKFLKTAHNRHMQFPSGFVAVQEFTSIRHTFSSEDVDQPFYIFFKATNFTDEEEVTAGCLTLYMEIEFVSPHYRPPCARNSLTPSNTPVTLIDGNQANQLVSAAANQNLEQIYSVEDLGSTFFTYRDFYVPMGFRGDQDEWQVTISLQQKFAEFNNIDFVIEVLDTDVTLNDMNYFDHPERPTPEFIGVAMTRRFQDSNIFKARGSQGPACKGMCHIGGEKAFNEMLRRLNMNSGTYFRVWLMQDTLDESGYNSQICANYQLIVTANKRKELDAATAAEAHTYSHCSAVELPSSLDTHRYLKGIDGKQKDFHYQEHFRVDHLWHNQAHRIQFKLNEPSLIRVIAPLHRHLEFMMVLNEEIGYYNHKTLLTAQKEDFHSSFFAQLSPGDYHIKFEFVSDATLLQLPCQTIQLEIEVMTVANAKTKANLIAQNVPRDSVSVQTFSIQDLFQKAPTKGPQMFEMDMHYEHLPMKAAYVYDKAKIQVQQITAGQKPVVDQRQLYTEILRAGFKIDSNDGLGLEIDVQSDFLLSGVNIAISNVDTGNKVEDERTETSGKLLMTKLKPGYYELIVYTHKCATNMNSAEIQNFDLMFRMSFRLLKQTGSGFHGMLETFQLGIFSTALQKGLTNQRPQITQTFNVEPELVSPTRLFCRKHFNELPLSFNEGMMIFGGLDFSRRFFASGFGFFSHEIWFIPNRDHDALRIMLGQFNAKISLLTEDKKLVAQSYPIEFGKAQLLLATKLDSNQNYRIIIEISELQGAVDGSTQQECVAFILSAKTFNSNSLCTSSQSSDSLLTTISATEEAKHQTILLHKSRERNDLTFTGSPFMDVILTVDYSDSFYVTEIGLQTLAAQPQISQSDPDLPDTAEVQKQMMFVEPDDYDFSLKQSSRFVFRDLPEGKYDLMLRQQGKPNNCDAAVTLTFEVEKSQDKKQSNPQVATLMTLFQSQHEEAEDPREAIKLPLNLKTLKFKAEQTASIDTSTIPLVFSGPVQLTSEDSSNVIVFTIEEDNTLVRFYIEHEAMHINVVVKDTVTKTPQFNMFSMYSGVAKILNKGDYIAEITMATKDKQKNVNLEPPVARLTIMVAAPKAQSYYNSSWGSVCTKEANFPLALRQEVMKDMHQLLYNYENIEVSKDVLASKSVLQTYHFRINVTSRMYFEVGMNLVNSHVTLQLTNLGQGGQPILGKQRGHLNVIDTEIGPGDYSVAIKQAANPGAEHSSTCGIFSLQGLAEPVNLMSEAGQRGHIYQRGMSSLCEGATNEVLPRKIFGSISQTKGGGELHVDGQGHFMKKFRNLLFKHSVTGANKHDEYDYIDLDPVEDSLLHLAFLYNPHDDRDIQVDLLNTFMFAQTVPQQAAHRTNEEGHAELVIEFYMKAGQHYTLSIHYLGGAESFQDIKTDCPLYDLTVSIVHVPTVLEEAMCRKFDQKVESMSQGLQHVIRDKDLDQNGNYTFSKLLKLKFPDDFSKTMKYVEKGQLVDALNQQVSIDLSSNFDLRASIDFPFDQAYFTIEFAESVKDSNGDWQTSLSHEQSPIMYNRNNDNQKTMRREIVAEDVQSEERNRRHTLIFSSKSWMKSPTSNSLLDRNVQRNNKSCIYVAVQIYVQATKKPSQSQFQNQHNVVRNPQLVAVRPDESPVFVHGKTTKVNFELIFNARPYVAHLDKSQRSDEESIASVIHLKTKLLTLPEGETREVLLSPVSVETNKKKYEGSEYHVAVQFNVRQYSGQATEKILHGELQVATPMLVDERGTIFEKSKKLSSNGLPIYVFKDTDQDEMIKEERQKTDNTLQDDYDKTIVTNRETQKSSLDKQVKQLDSDDVPSKFSNKKKPVECKCVHGKCRDGESTCSGGCDQGWTGEFCSMPTDNKAFTNTHTQNKKDFTKDGLYRPTTISDNEYTPSRRSESSNSEGTVAKKIDDSSQNVINWHSTAQREQVHQDSEGTQATNFQEQTETTTEDSGQLRKGAQVVLVIIVLYVLFNGCPSLGNSVQRRSRPPQSKFENDLSKNDSDEEEDPVARRRMMELSSLKTNKDFKQLPQNDEEEVDSTYVESKQPQNQRGFPMTSFSPQKKQNPVSALQEDDAAQLQRELELFAQEDDGEEDAALMKNKSDDHEIAEFESYFQNKQ